MHLYLSRFEANDAWWIGLYIETPCDDCASNPNNNEQLLSNCTSCRKQWTWRDETIMTNSESNLMFNGWWSNEPTGGQNCARLELKGSRSGYWYDIGDIEGCNSDYNVICKKGKICFNL